MQSLFVNSLAGFFSGIETAFIGRSTDTYGTGFLVRVLKKWVDKIGS